jgi:hypothetical protein
MKSVTSADQVEMECTTYVGPRLDGDSTTGMLAKKYLRVLGPTLPL